LRAADAAAEQAELEAEERKRDLYDLFGREKDLEPVKRRRCISVPHRAAVDLVARWRTEKGATVRWLPRVTETGMVVPPTGGAHGEDEEVYDIDPPREIQRLSKVLAFADVSSVLDGAVCEKHGRAFYSFTTEPFTSHREDGHPFADLARCSAAHGECCVRGHLRAPIRVHYNVHGDNAVDHPDDKDVHELWKGGDDVCPVCGAQTCRLASPEATGYPEWREDFEAALGKLIPESAQSWHREAPDFGGIGELKLNLCRNGHFSGVCWKYVPGTNDRDGPTRIFPSWRSESADRDSSDDENDTERVPQPWSPWPSLLPVPAAPTPIAHAALMLPADYMGACIQQRAADTALIRQLLSAHPDGLAALDRLFSVIT
jgi:hypothetical protein